MKKIALLLSLGVLLPAGAALADDDACFVPRERWQPREAVAQLAAGNGWTVREIGIDDGCYEIEGRDRDGHRIEVKIDPATLQVVEMERDRAAGTSPARDAAPAGTAPPPAGTLFGNGAPPKAQVN